MKDKASRGLVWLSRGCSVLVAVLLMQVGGASYAGAQATPNAAVQGAYELAMKCFVASGHARMDRHAANDMEGASRYEGKEKRAFDMASKLGEQLGYSKDHIQDDYKAAMDRELPRLMYEPGYFAQTATQCRAYGLM